MAVEPPCRFVETADGLYRDPEVNRGYSVYGYVDDRTRFWAEIDAPTPKQGDRLLAALLTLQRDGKAGPVAADA